MPLRIGLVQDAIESLPEKSSLLDAEVEARDAGPDRTEITASIRTGRLLSPFLPAITRALDRKMLSFLFPALAPAKVRSGIFEYAFFLPLAFSRSNLGRPFVAPGPAGGLLFLHLTQRPVPFEENAVSFEVLEAAAVRPAAGPIEGFVPLSVTRHTIFLPGSGGALRRMANRFDVGLCDESKGLETIFRIDIEKPFGLGDTLPPWIKNRRIFSGTPESRLAIHDQVLRAPVNEIWFGKTRGDIAAFLGALLGNTVTISGPCVFVPRLQIESAGVKVLSVGDLTV